MGPKLRKTPNAVNSRSKASLTAQKKSAGNRLKRRSANNENNIKGGYAVKIKSLELTENQKSYEQKNSMVSNRTVLGNRTNESPAAKNYMALRTKNKAKSDSGLESSSSTSLSDLSFDSNVIRSPRSNKLDKKRFSIKNVDVCQIPVYKKSYVLLENIDELREKDSQTSSNPSNSQQKACVYRNIKTTDENSKSASHMLPEEKLALYEFEVDENEPKPLKKKRKRKPRIKKPDTSDSDQSPFMSVVKQMRHLTTGNRARIITNTPSSGLPVQASQVFKQLPSVVNVANKASQKNMTLKTPTSVNMCRPISPIERSGSKPILYSPKTVRFANSPSANSTPRTPALIQKTGQTSELQNEASPTLKINTRRHGGVSSIYIRPNSNVHHKFVLDDSICSENEEPTPLSPKTPPNIQELQPVLRHKIGRTTSMQHFFSPENGANCSNNSIKTNLDASGLFDDSPDSSPKHEPRCSMNSSASFSSFVTNRKKYQLNHPNNNNSSYSSRFFNDSSDCHRRSSQPPKKLSMTFDDHVTVRKKYIYVPRVSSFEPRDSMPECGGEGELTLENYFGFDDDIEDETTAPLMTVATTSNFNSKIPASSTPYHSNVLSTKPQPARIGVGDLKKILAPLVVKKPEYSGTHPQATYQSLTPTSVQSSPARHSYRGPIRFKRVHYDEDLEDEHGTPEKKPKKKKREVKVKDTVLKREEDLWYADVNSHFNDIEDMELCVE